MKNLAVIPARGGSKRIPRKNIRLFCGKPIIAYPIEVALNSNCFDKVIVSTDDEEIARVALDYGAEVPFLRPANISDDMSTMKQVIDHVLSYLKDNNLNYDNLCTIYATSPLLKEKYLIEGLEKLVNSDAVNAFSCTSMPFPIQRTFKLNDNNRCKMFWPENFNIRSQDLEEAYQDAGQFYWKKIRMDSSKILFDSDSIGIIIPRHLVQDIDTLEDWKRAEYLYKAINSKVENDVE